MELSEVVASIGGQSKLAEAIGCNKSYVSRACKRGRAGTALAVRIFRATGMRTGVVIDATSDQIDMMERLALRGEAA